MRFLIVGAGALGGYFGGRLLAAGQDVEFLVRARRAAQLQAHGLSIRSPLGNLDIASPPHRLSEDIEAPYDVVLVGCKSYDLPHTIDSFAAAVGPDTAILPLLNGMQHLELLGQRFGRPKVLGGVCLISAALDNGGTVLHLNDTHTLRFGELDGQRSARVDAIASAFAAAQFDGPPSDRILHEMWEKWTFIAALAGLTTLLRASVGDAVEAGAQALGLQLLDECAAIASHNGFPPSPQALERARAMLTARGSPITASMLKDVERGAPTEAAHILSDLLRRGAPQPPAPQQLLRVACANMRTYEARRAREEAARAA